MATRQQIKDTIMDVAGNPESGIVKKYADLWADAIVALDAPAKPAKEDKAEREVKETRVISSVETR